MSTLPIPPGGGGLSNPMSAAGDLINGGTGGAAQRLPIGTVGQVLSPSNSTNLAWRDDGIVIKATWDGSGSAITAPKILYCYVPFAITIQAITLLADQSGTATVDIWKCTYTQFDAGSTHPVVGDSIVGAGTKPNLAGPASKYQDSTLTSFTLPVAADSVLAFDLSAAGTITRLETTIKAAHG